MPAKFYPKLLLILTLLAGGPTLQADEKKADVPPPPDLPPVEIEEQDRLQADVVIRKGKDKVIEEYRVNGELYMVRITPKLGKPYYIRYPDGPRGRAIRRELDDINTPFWKLFEW